MDTAQIATWVHANNAQFRELVTGDPGIPDGSVYFPHGLSSEWTSTLMSRTDVLPEKASYVIIGSGITACSVAHTILYDRVFDGQDVVVLENGMLASGATGHSTNLLRTATMKDWGDVARSNGVTEATAVAESSHCNLKRLRAVVESLPQDVQDEVQFRRITTITNFQSPAVREQYERCEVPFRKACPEPGDSIALRDAEFAKSKYQLAQSHGVLEGPGATLEAGKLVAGIFRELQRKFGDRFTIETWSTVTKVEDDPTNTSYPYKLSTSRGEMLAGSVIYCVNGWTSHLRPRLRGKIFPLRSTTTDYQLPKAPFDYGLQYSWTLIDQPSVDIKTNLIFPGQYSITQYPGHARKFRVKGEPMHLKSLVPEQMTDVDSFNISARKHDELMKETLQPPSEELGEWVAVDDGQHSSPALEQLTQPDPFEPAYTRRWRSAMGYCTDLHPLVGRVPDAYTGRHGNLEWIADGCNGSGLDKCWLMGEALVNMMANRDVTGQGVVSWDLTGDLRKHVRWVLPTCYTVSKDRLDSLQPDKFLQLWLQRDTFTP